MTKRIFATLYNRPETCTVIGTLLAIGALAIIWHIALYRFASFSLIPFLPAMDSDIKIVKAMMWMFGLLFPSIAITNAGKADSIAYNISRFKNDFSYKLTLAFTLGALMIIEFLLWSTLSTL